RPYHPRRRGERHQPRVPAPLRLLDASRAMPGLSPTLVRAQTPESPVAGLDPATHVSLLSDGALEPQSWTRGSCPREGKIDTAQPTRTNLSTLRSWVNPA